MTDAKVPKITFAPGVLEQLESENTPEELQKFLDELQAMAEDGSILECSQVVNMDELKVEDPELYEVLAKQLEGVFDSEDTPPTLH